MLFNHEQQQPIRNNTRIVYIYQNASKNNKLLLELKLSKKKVKFSEIAKMLGYTHLRLFNAEGAEYEEDDLEYVKDKTTLYASKGQEFDPSSSFGEYKIVKEIGEGGFGKVLLGEHKMTKQRVAIKIIKTENIGTFNDIDSIFVEAEILKSLHHQNIVKVYNCLTLVNMQVAIIMEYLEGGQLLAYIQEKDRLAQAQAKIFFKQIVKAMGYCHVNNLIHRDLKLQNLLLVNHEEKKIKIIDFGIAGVASNFKVQEIDTGSLNYMAPECFYPIKDRKIDAGVDVWATGVILFGLLVGDLPFKGSTNNDKIEAIKSGIYKIPSSIMKQLSEQCLDALKRCLDVNPKTRITMDELISHPWISDTFFAQPKKQIKQEPKVKVEEKPIKSPKLVQKPSSTFPKRVNIVTKGKK